MLESELMGIPPLANENLMYGIIFASFENKNIVKCTINQGGVCPKLFESNFKETICEKDRKICRSPNVNMSYFDPRV